MIGDCRLGPVIGRGGAGTVFRAVQLGVNRQVAVKLIPLADAVHLSVQGVKSQLRTLSERFGCGDLPQNRKRLALAERAMRSGVGVG